MRNKKNTTVAHVIEDMVERGFPKDKTVLIYRAFTRLTKIGKIEYEEYTPSRRLYDPSVIHDVVRHLKITIRDPEIRKALDNMNLEDAGADDPAMAG